MIAVVPMGNQGEGPKGRNYVNFKHLLLQIQKAESHNILYVDTFICEEFNLFMRSPGVAPLGPCRGLNLGWGTSRDFFFGSVCKELVKFVSKFAGNHVGGQGMPNCLNGTCSTYGGPGEGPPRAKTVNFKHLLQNGLSDSTKLGRNHRYG